MRLPRQPGRGGFPTHQFQAKEAGEDEQEGEDSQEAGGVGEEGDADEEGAGGADSGPDGVGGADGDVPLGQPRKKPLRAIDNTARAMNGHLKRVV